MYELFNAGAIVVNVINVCTCMYVWKRVRAFSHLECESLYFGYTN